jgi:hypothetical protein
MAMKSLPADWVDRIFARLQGAYGREFTGQFSMIDQSTGIDIGIENAKVVWGEELAMFADNAEAIAYGLKSLPEKAPNVLRFRETCKMAPARNKAPQVSYNDTATGNYQPGFDKVREHITQLRSTLGMPKFGDNKYWAKKILEEHQAGVPKTSTVLAMARKALGEKQGETA